MKITEREKKILGAIELNSEISAKELAKRTSLKIHTVQYLLRSLREQSIILGNLPLIDYWKLGKTNILLYLALSNNTPLVRKQLIQYLITHPQVSWSSELGGKFQFGTALLADRISDVDQFLDKLTKETKAKIVQYELTIRLSFSVFPRAYLDPIALKNKAIHFSDNTKLFEPDFIDEQILNDLTQQGYKSERETAREIGENPVTVHRHFQDLKESGVIKGFMPLIDLNKLQLQKYKVLIGLLHRNKHAVQQVFSVAEKNPHIINFARCLGDRDIELGLEVRSNEELSREVSNLYSCLGDEIISLEIIPVLRYFEYE